MNYSTAYSLPDNRFTKLYIFPFPFFAFFATLFIVSIFCNLFSTTMKISLGFVTIMFLWLSLLILFQMLADEKYIFTPFRNNSCEVVEGMVSDFSPKSRINRNEFFYVSGLKFAVPNSSSKIGYSTLKINGGVITENGQNVRITYVYNKMLGNDAVIVKIEIEEK